MAKLPYMPFYCSDYLNDTAHLSETADRAYFHLLIHYWIRQAGLPEDDAQLARMAGLSLAKWRSVKAEVLPFFTAGDGMLTQKRMEKEIQIVQEKVKKAKVAADFRWHKERTN